MFTFIKHEEKSLLRRTATQCIVFILSFSLIFSPSAIHAQSINFLNLPIPGTLVQPSSAMAPVLLKGMTIHPDDPLKFDFIVDGGNAVLTQDEVQQESEKLVKYFLASMTIPKDDLWVNLSPHEKDRIIPEELGKTELGRDMLAQDYILKQLTASLMYPEEELGKKFWDKVYKKAYAEYGVSEIPVNTFNKVWIIPDRATVYEHEHTVYVVDTYLKVMLDSDYVASREALSVKRETNPRDTNISSEIIREIIIPAIEQEVNEGEHFAPLRQIYHSLILAKWYKETIKNSLLSQVYVDQNMIDGVDVEDKTIKDQIYAQYIEAYKKGVFNYIKEDYDQLSQEIIPRKYFSGGLELAALEGDLTRSGPYFEISDYKKYHMGVVAKPTSSSSPLTDDEIAQHAARFKKILNERASHLLNEHEYELIYIPEDLGKSGNPNAIPLLKELEALVKTTRIHNIEEDYSDPKSHILSSIERALSMLRRGGSGSSAGSGSSSPIRADIPKIRKIIADQLEIDIGGVDLDASLIDDLGASAADVAQMILNIERAHDDIKIPDRIADYVDTGRDIINYIESLDDDSVSGRPADPGPSAPDSPQGASSPVTTSLPSILNQVDIRFNIQYSSRQTVADVFDEATQNYYAALKDLAQSGQGNVEDRIRAAEEKRMESVRQFYDIGIKALGGKLEGLRGKADPLIALFALNKVLQKQVLMKHAYGETVLGSEYTLADDVVPNLMTKERAQDEGYSDAYIENIDAVKDARKKYVDAFQAYLSKEERTGVVAVENIIYDLGLSDEQLFWGVNEQNGRSSEYLIETALALREMLFSKDGRVSYAMKAQTASYLNKLFSKYFHNGKAARDIDQGGGLSVPSQVYREVLDGEDLEKAELRAFLTFIYHPDYEYLKGHSRTSMSWLAEIYSRLSQQYYEKSVRDAVEIEKSRIRTQVTDLKNSLGKLHQLNDMLAEFKEKFPKIQKTFRQGGGLYTELPIRLELSAGGAQDSTFLSTFRPSGYNILNLAAQLSREDGTLGRNIGVTFEVRDLNDMPEVEEGGKTRKSLISVESLDLGFKVHATKTGDIEKKSKASLVFDALISLGLVPEAIINKAKEGKGRNDTTKKEEKALKEIVDHVFGKNKGLAVTLHVRDITAGSGLAVSSMLAMGVAATFDSLFENTTPETNTVSRLKVKNLEKRKDYVVEISKDEHFHPDSQIFTYNYASLEDEHVTIDLVPEELSRNGEYYIRVAKVIDNTIENWTTSDALKLDQAKTVNGFEISIVNKQYLWKDNQTSVKEAIVTSQETVLRQAGRAGTQDEVSGLGGVMFLTAGEKLEGNIDGGRAVHFEGGVVPEMTEVQLTPEVQKRLEEGLRILRVGISEDAEDTLEQIFVNTILNTTRDQQNAWGQISIEMTKALARGDIVELGRLANAAVPLRERMAPISISPVVLKALEEIKHQYGDDYQPGSNTPGVGFSYGITGARSTGSLLLFFDPILSEQRKSEILDEIVAKIEDSINSVGKLSPREENPHVFERWQVSDQGTRVQVLTKEEMAQHNQMNLDIHRKNEEAQRLTNQEKHVLYSKETVDDILEKNKPSKPSTLRGKEVRTLNKRILERLGTDGHEFNLDNISEREEEIRKQATEAFREEFERFKAQGVNEKMRDLIKKRLSENFDKIHALPNQEDIRIFLALVLTGEVDLLWHFDEDTIIGIIDAHRNKEESKFAKLKEDLEKAYAYTKRVDDIKEAIENHAKIEEDMEKSPMGKSEFDGTSFTGSAFREAIDIEIADLKTSIRELSVKIEGNPKRTQKDKEVLESDKYDLQEKKTLLKRLERAPNPEALPYNDFLFEKSKTYRKLFGEKVAALKEAVEDGALVPVIAAGGMGGRFFKGSKVKAVAPFHSGNESDASYLKLLIRRWADFLERFPKFKESFLLIGTSVFTEHAIRAVLESYAREENLNPDNIAIGGQTLRQPTFASEAELALDMALKITSTQAEKNELRREYGRRLDIAKQKLKKQNEREEQKEREGLSGAKKYDRARYEQDGLNPLNQYIGIGNVGSLESILSGFPKEYTLENLRNAGYPIDERRVQQMNETSEGRKQLSEGMPLAKAALLVRGNGLSIGIIQQSSSRARIGGGDLAIADAISQFNNPKNKKDVLAVAQYTNTAAGTEMGGVLVKKENGAVTTLEGHRMSFAEATVLEQNYASIATGTVFINLKKIYKILGYETERHYLQRSQEDISNRIQKEYYEKRWENLYTVKERKEEKPGESEMHQVLLAEVALPWVLTWIQEQEEFGREAVRYQEVTAEVAFADDKTLAELQNGLDLMQHHRATSTRTKLPPGEIENFSLSANHWIKWAEYYLTKGFFTRAEEAIAYARRSLPPLERRLTRNEIKEVLEYEAELEHLSEEVKENVAKKDLIFADVPSFGTRLMQYFNESRRGDEVDDMELLTHITHTENILMQKTGKVLNLLKEELKDNYSESLLLAAVALMLNGEEVESVLEHYGINGRTITKRTIEEIQSEIKAMRDVDHPQHLNDYDNPVRLAYLRKELTAIYDQTVEGKVNAPGFRTSLHKVTLLVDKDATIEDPGTPLKQIKSKDHGKELHPERARKIINYAMRGAQVNILTGSTAKEAWEQVFEPVAQLLLNMQVPDIMKQMAIARIQVLANDGTITVEIETGDDGRFNVKPLVDTEKFEYGDWVKASDLGIKAENGDEIKKNRRILWEESLKQYLATLFTYPAPKDLLDIGDQDAVQEFISALSLRDDDIPDMLTPKARLNQSSFEEPMAGYIKTMIDNYKHKHGESNKVLKRFDDIFKTEKSAQGKLGEDGTREKLSPDEKLYAAFYLIRFKDSAGTYGSISGDQLEKQNNIDGRVFELKETILNQGFWESLKERFDAQIEGNQDFKVFVEIEGQKVKVLTEKKDGDKVEKRNIASVTRAGPGYLNMSFGGVSKKNYLEGMLQDRATKGHVVIIMGDSRTDQGHFPYISRVSLDNKKLDFSDARAYLRENNNQLPDILQEHFNYNEAENEVQLKGELSAEEARLIFRNVDEKLRPVVRALFRISRKVHEGRIPIRVLLGGLTELDDQQIEEHMDAGLIRTQYQMTEADPVGDGYDIERWGPAGFYHVVEGVLDVAQRELVLPDTKVAGSPVDLSKRDRFLRGVIGFIRANGFNMVVPQTMRQVKKEAEQTDSPERREGYFLNPTIDFKQGEKVELDELRQLISSRTDHFRTQEEVYDLLKEADSKVKSESKDKKKKLELAVKGHLRGIDGPGSTLDLLPIQRALNKRINDKIQEGEQQNFDNMPTSATIASAFRSSVTLEVLSEEKKDQVLIVGPDYGYTEEHPYIYEGMQNVGQAQRRMTDRKIEIIGYILKDLFGISGVQVSLSKVNPFALAAGVDSTNLGFTLGIVAAANILTNAKLTMADVYNLTIKLENEQLGFTTGGQGHIAAIFSGAYEYAWGYGLNDALELADNRPKLLTALATPILTRKQLAEMEEHVLLVQPGRKYKDGKPTPTRDTAFLNNIWISLAEHGSEEHLDLFVELDETAEQYIQSLKVQNYKGVVNAIKRYQKIRYDLIEEWYKIFKKVEEGEENVLAGLPQALVDHMKGLIADDSVKYNSTSIRKVLDQDQYIKDMIKKAEKRGIAIMPLGAGGPGSNLIAVHEDGIQPIREFLEEKRDDKEKKDKEEEGEEKDKEEGKEEEDKGGYGLNVILGDDAKRVIEYGGKIKGYMYFKAGHEPMSFEGFDQIEGITESDNPAMPEFETKSFDDFRNEVEGVSIAANLEETEEEVVEPGDVKEEESSPKPLADGESSPPVEPEADDEQGDQKEPDGTGSSPIVWEELKTLIEYNLDRRRGSSFIYANKDLESLGSIIRRAIWSIHNQIRGGDVKTELGKVNALADKIIEGRFQLRGEPVDIFGTGNYGDVKIGELDRNIAREMDYYYQINSFEENSLSLWRPKHGLRNILLVDDSEKFQIRLSADLRSRGVDATRMSDGRDVIKHFDAFEGDINEAADLIITDNLMEDLNGIDLVPMLRERGFQGPIVIVTTNPEDGFGEGGFLHKTQKDSDSFHYELNDEGIERFGANTIIVNKWTNRSDIGLIAKMLNAGETVPKITLSVDTDMSDRGSGSPVTREEAEAMIEQKFSELYPDKTLSSDMKSDENINRVIQLGGNFSILHFEAVWGFDQEGWESVRHLVEIGDSSAAGVDESEFYFLESPERIEIIASSPISDKRRKELMAEFELLKQEFSELNEIISNKPKNPDLRGLEVLTPDVLRTLELQRKLEAIEQELGVEGDAIEGSSSPASDDTLEDRVIMKMIEKGQLKEVRAGVYHYEAFFDEISAVVLNEVPETIDDFDVIIHGFEAVPNSKFFENDKVGTATFYVEVVPSSSPITPDKEVGGIDMNDINVDRQGAGVDIQFDPIEIQEIIDQGVTGFAPVIINFVPLPSVLPLLGLEPKREEDYELSSLN